MPLWVVVWVVAAADVVALTLLAIVEYMNRRKP